MRHEPPPRLRRAKAEAIVRVRASDAAATTRAATSRARPTTTVRGGRGRWSARRRRPRVLRARRRRPDGALPRWSSPTPAPRPHAAPTARRAAVDSNSAGSNGSRSTPPEATSDGHAGTLRGPRVSVLPSANYVLEGSRGEPWGDRGARSACAARDRRPVGGGVFGGRPRRAPRPSRRRGVPDRRGPAGRVATSTSGTSSKPPSGPAPTRSIPATGSSPRTPTSRGRRSASHLHRPAGGSHRPMGDKVAARQAAVEAGAPVVPGTLEPVKGSEEIRAFAEEHGFPIAIKASFGGGGRGFKVVRSDKELEDAFASAQRESRWRSGGTRSTSSATSKARAISRRRSWPTSTAPCCSSASATAHCSAATRSSSRSRRPRSSPGDARRHQRGIGRDRPRGRLRERRDDRNASRRRSEELLLHGDEHAAPGRASGDRTVRRHRPREVAGTDRGGREAPFHARRDRASRACDRVRINAEDPAKKFFPAPGRIGAIANRPGPACGSIPASAPTRRSRVRTTR